MMAEYIEREAAIARLKEIVALYEQNLCREEASGLKRGVTAIAARPAADVAPVVRGYWVKPFWAIGRNRVCSVCHSVVRMPSVNFGEYAEYPGCPWCLARMDRGDNNAAD